MSVGVRHRVILGALAAFVLGIGAAAAATPVDLALVLAVDVSRSVDDDEYRIQKEGYADAFRSRPVLEAIESGGLGIIAVTYVEWSGNGRQRQLVPWTLIRGPESAGAFADAIQAAPRAFADFTAVGGAIDFATRLFGEAEVEPTRRVIDVSGDGISNSGPPASEARDRALAAGITVNALTILNEQWKLGGWYAENVVGGTTAFLMHADHFDDFKVAIISKLVREIASHPPNGDGTLRRLATAAQP